MKLIGSAFVVLCLFALKVSTQDFDDSDEAVVDTEEEQVDVPYESPVPFDETKVYFSEHFDDEKTFNKRWVKSQAKKEGEGISEDIAKYDGEWSVEPSQKDSLQGDKGLVLKSKAKHAAISAKLFRPFVFTNKPLVVQYEVTLQEEQECGGSYLKLLSSSPDMKDLKLFHDKTPYTIMFGPDKCGNDIKLHFIFKHMNPLNGSIEEKHCKKPEERLEEYFTDKLPHLYTLILKPDNTFKIMIDNVVVNEGSLLEDFTPPVNPPAEIDDPNDKKPSDWDEREKIHDPEAVKPEDWDEDAPAQIVDESAVMPDGWLENEPTHIPDPDAKRPEDWDSEMDGEWEPPLIDNPKCADAVGCGHWEPPLINNPKYKGKWHAPLIDNPNYKGKWRPRTIPNPDYFQDKEPFKMQTVDAVGFELWSMSKNILFDNIIITDDAVVAQQWAVDTFDKKRQKIAKDSGTLWGRLMKALNYHPKIWGLYFVYCAIPVVFYAYYLWRCVSEENIVQRVANLTNQYPILWVVYIIILGIPVVLFLYCCCSSSSSTQQLEKEEQRAAAAEKKKTDDATADDPEAEPVIREDEEEEDEEEVDREKHSDPDDKEDDDVEVVENENAEESSPIDAAAGDGSRKRKVRKE